MSQQNRSILIVDDDFDVRDALMDVLSDLGQVGVAVEDGFAAVEHLASHPAPRLILLDYMMPRCNGADFRVLQLKNEKWRAIPTVLLSAHPEAVEKARSLGLDGVLRKPVQLDAFIRLIERHCGASRPAAATAAS